MTDPAISQMASRSACSSPSSSSSSMSSPAAAAIARRSMAPSSRRCSDSPSRRMAVWQMCLTWSVDRMPGPAFFRHVVTPSARVRRAITSTSVESNSGRTLFRNSMTSSLTTCTWPAFCEQLQSSAQVSKERSRMSSAMEKSKTGSRALAVCATKPAYAESSSSTNVWMHSSADFRSCISEEYIMRTCILPPTSVSVRLTSPSGMSPACSASNSLGASVSFSRTPGRMCGTNGRKSCLSVEQMRSAADIMYSFTGSLAGRLGIAAAWIMACMMTSASALKPSRPTALASSEMHSKHLPRRVRSFSLCRVAWITCFRMGMSAG
mmetsp:Transcript_104716/g.225943  ORF Transcript_104716/g.225943 Transcript_104716/m.225943 type:complete len:322 (+) Transcript_104716:784-1749(+)